MGHGATVHFTCAMVAATEASAATKTIVTSKGRDFNYMTSLHCDRTTAVLASCVHAAYEHTSKRYDGVGGSDCLSR